MIGTRAYPNQRIVTPAKMLADGAGREMERSSPSPVLIGSGNCTGEHAGPMMRFRAREALHRDVPNEEAGAAPFRIRADLSVPVKPEDAS